MYLQVMGQSTISAVPKGRLVVYLLVEDTPAKLPKMGSWTALAGDPDDCPDHRIMQGYSRISQRFGSDIANGLTWPASSFWTLRVLMGHAAAVIGLLILGRPNIQNSCPKLKGVEISGRLSCKSRYVVIGFTSGFSVVRVSLSGSFL
ncbi:hypothetical protein PIB30_015631 [Stylosanthes scabra]|uniref:Uncharacterized protein n=1 Tax=Stylosanthes scabra TaxID=79078 RepID=A0ABU6S7F6_9FABA|nr:hypothetical protein [Stylosanthes scabra]